MSNKHFRQFLSPITRFLPFEKLVPRKDHRFIFPFWHAVSNVEMPHLKHLYRVPTSSEFQRDLDFLLLNYKPASFADVLEQTNKGGKAEPRLFFPSFDDGMSECYHLIAPILKRKGIQAAFFINPAFVDNKTLFHRHKASLILNIISKKPSGIKDAELLLQQRNCNRNLLQFLHHATFADHPLLDEIANIFDLDFDKFLAHNQPYMTLGQIKELQEDEFLIGAHGMDHREFYHSSEDEIMAQITASLYFVNQNIHPPIKSFAFPFTDFKVVDTVFEKANQDKLWDLSFGTAGIKDENIQNHFQRIPMESARKLDAKQIIGNEYLWYYLKSVFGKNKVRR